jgi:hypothetical protein
LSTQTNFTASRETAFPAARAAYEESLDKMMGIPFGQFAQGFDYADWRDTTQRWRVAAWRERDHESRTRLVLWWKSIDGFDMDRFERVGRHFVRWLAFDHLARTLGVERGGALSAKPNEELRRKIQLYKSIQAAREAAFEFIGKGEYGGKDVPARLGLGGLQDFTAGP